MRGHGEGTVSKHKASGLWCLACQRLDRHSAKLLETWYALLTRLELPRVTFHALRHSAATNALAAGATLEDVKQMLGHSSIRITSDVYAHPDLGRAREVAAMLERGFGG